ncbi:molybdate ABC transporter substrate-binding protein [Negadavirga shengliensis]|uniref:Molybdate ABC transporter substrate-binding protein n=1 Tax=Negadavirga shengliensis TaxID=1389218 RepID=A0ABV9SVU5_9BACT
MKFFHMTFKIKGQVLLLAFLICWISHTSTAQSKKENTVLVAAASDLKFALDAIILEYTSIKPVKIEAIYGSSGKLFEQIFNKAPFHIFMSADIQYPTLLAERGLAGSAVFHYGVGRLVLWSKNMDTGKSGIELLTDPRVKKIAIANPQHAPYGRGAEEAMKYYNVYPSIEKKLVFGENISQTAQFVSTGAADIGVIALSLALAPNMKRLQSSYFLIPEESHSPLLQGAIITAYGKDHQAARDFFEFLKSDSALKILQFYGFSKP